MLAVKDLVDECPSDMRGQMMGILEMVKVRVLSQGSLLRAFRGGFGWTRSHGKDHCWENIDEYIVSEHTVAILEVLTFGERSRCGCVTVVWCCVCFDGSFSMK